MIKKKGCMPCKEFEPFVKQTAEKYSLGFRTIMGENMPENLQCDLKVFKVNYPNQVKRDR